MIWTVVTYGVLLVVNVVVLGLVPERRRPSSAMAWLLLIFFLPGIGLLLFLLFGSPFVPRKRREEQRVAGELIRIGLATVPALPASPDRPGVAGLGDGVEPAAGLAAEHAEQHGGVVR